MAQVRETELDAGALARALFRRLWLLLLLAALAGAGTYYALGFVEPLYTADTSILIEERESPITRPRDQAPESGLDLDESAIQSQVEVLRSREIAEKVIDRLDLTRRPEFDPATKPSLISSLSVLLGVKRPPTDDTIRQRVMDSYFERLSVYPLQKSRVIAVTFVAPSPTLAAEVANAVAEAFVDLQQDAKRESAVAATDWLQQEIERLRERVAEAEQEVADYRERNQLFNVEQSGNLPTQQLSDLNAELARARAARAEAEARAKLVDQLLAEGGSLESSEEVLDSQLIQRLQERQVALRSQIADLSTTLLPAHPRIRALQGQLGNLEEQMRQEARKIQASLNTAARVAAAREQSLLESIENAKVDVSRSDESEIELRALEREAAAQRGLLESLLTRYREAAARTDANYLPADARIISRAVPPRQPSFPKKTLMSIAAALATFLLAATILLLRQFTSGRAFRLVDHGGTEPPGRWGEPVSYAPVPVTYPVPEQVFRPTQERYPVQVREIERREPDVVAVSPVRTEPPEQGPAPEAATLVAAPAAESNPEHEVIPLAPAVPGAAAAAGAAGTAEESEPAGAPPQGPGPAELAEILASEAVRVAMFAGSAGGEGAGRIAFAAASGAASRGVRPVLLDLGSTPSEALGGYEQPGLGDLLGGDVAFGEVIQRDEASRVHFIPMGAMGKNPPLQRLQVVIGALTHTYDKVIVVADSIRDWPNEIRPDFAAVIAAPDSAEDARTEARQAALARGAGSALVVPFAGLPDDDRAGDGRRPNESAETSEAA